MESLAKRTAIGIDDLGSDVLLHIFKRVLNSSYWWENLRYIAILEAVSSRWSLVAATSLDSLAFSEDCAGTLEVNLEKDQHRERLLGTIRRVGFPGLKALLLSGSLEQPLLKQPLLNGNTQQGREWADILAVLSEKNNRITHLELSTLISRHFSPSHVAVTELLGDNLSRCLYHFRHQLEVLVFRLSFHVDRIATFPRVPKLLQVFQRGLPGLKKLAFTFPMKSKAWLKLLDAVGQHCESLTSLELVCPEGGGCYNAEALQKFASRRGAQLEELTVGVIGEPQGSVLGALASDAFPALQSLALCRWTRMSLNWATSTEFKFPCPPAFASSLTKLRVDGLRIHQMLPCSRWNQLSGLKTLVLEHVGDSEDADYFDGNDFSGVVPTNLPSLTTLEISDSHLVHSWQRQPFDDFFLGFPELTSVSFSNDFGDASDPVNDRIKVPTSLSQLSNLQSLHVSSFTDESLNTIAKCKSLTRLVVDRISWTEIPHQLGQLESLVELDIGCCRRYSVEEDAAAQWHADFPQFLRFLTNLERLSLRDCGLKAVFRAIKHRTSLKVLRLTGSGKEVPATIATLRNLEVLELSASDHASLKKLPDAVEELLSIEVLKLGGTNIRRVPSAVGGLPHLKELCVPACVPRPASLPRRVTFWSRRTWCSCK